MLRVRSDRRGWFRWRRNVACRIDIGSGILRPISSRGDAAQGRHLFLMNCAHCHGDDARGDEGPDLHDFHKNDARIHQVITGGIKGEMPSFAKKLGDPEIRQLTAYLRTLRS